MGLTAAELGQRLVSARQAAGLSAKETASRAGIPETALVEAEAGQRVLPAGQLMDLAPLLGLPVSDLILGSKQASLRAKFRTGSNVSAVRMDVIGRQHAALLDLFDVLDSRPSKPLLRARPAPQALKQAYAEGRFAAQQLRRQLNLQGPVTDLLNIIQGHGLMVYEANLPPDVSGVFINPEEGHPTLLVQPEDSDNRQRFSLAHEFGHALLDANEESIVSTRDSELLVEVRANSFAGELLLPAADIESHCTRVGKRPDELDFIQLVQLAGKYHLSFAAMAYRLLINRSITHEQYDQLMLKEKNANGYRAQHIRDPPVTNRDSLDGRGHYLARTALKQGKITATKFREYCRIFDVPTAAIQAELEDA